jgi:uncharacterized RDD family membrane protein YckC
MEVWIGREGERHGPYQEEQVKEWLRSGQLSRDDLGWYDGLADWQPLSVLFPDDAAKPASPYAPPDLPRTSAPTTTVSYAGFWKRVLAYLIDCFVLYFPFSLLEIPFGTRAAEDALSEKIKALGSFHEVMVEYQHFYVEQWPYTLTTLVLGWLYFALCESSTWQGTLGKLAVGIRVTDSHGARIGLGRALGRYGGKLISAFLFCIGFLMVAFTRRKQGLHDFMVDTLVLNGRASDLAHRASASPSSDKTSFDA